MSEQKRKTALVVLYNHNFEKNIPVIRKIYGNRFSQTVQIMPFYYGSDDDVIRVYGNSFQFHTYIAQARERLKELDCDDFLIVGDDLLLHPSFNEWSTGEILNLKPGAFYIDGFVNVARDGYYRAVKEACNFCTSPAGVDASANRILPSYEKAEQILRERGILDSVNLQKVRPYMAPFVRPISQNLYKNYKVLRARAWHLRYSFKNKLAKRKMSYPCVFGYSDLISVPRERFDEWCNYLEIFATWRMFVELAIPTAMALLPNAEIVCADSTGKQTGNVWFPQDGAHRAKMESIIARMLKESDNCADGLADAYPDDYLYLHPVKLSKMK